MSAIFNREHEAPDADAGDAAYAVVRAALSGIPFIGTAAVELLQQVIAPPLARRQQDWMCDVAEAIRRLEVERGVRPEDLRDNPPFIDAVLTASQAAVRTSQQEKRQALLNAICHAGLPGAPEGAVQQMFIALVDRFTEWHLRILAIFADPQRWSGPSGRTVQADSSLNGILEQAYPELRGRRDLYDQIWTDLNNTGMVRTPHLHTMMTGQGTLQKRTTELGDQFLRYISTPAAK